MAKQYLFLFLISILALCYAVTLAPGLSWANGGADGGDLIAAAATGGVAHPSGYPLYLLLAGVFQQLPVGTLAFRTNLLSAICTILAALALQTLLIRQKISSAIALVAGLAFGLAPAVWGQAVITEVYALQSLLLILFLWGLLEENNPGGEWTRGLLFGLAACNHITTLLLLPLLLFRTAPQPGFTPLPVLFRRFFVCGTLIVLIYLTLWLRAAYLPPINWGNPASIENLWWLVSGQMYATYPFNLSLADAFLRLRTAGGLLLEQYTVLGVLLGIYGLFSGLSRSILLVSLWVFGSSTGFAVLYGSYDSQVYLIPAYLVFCIWLAYGIQDISRNLPPKLALFSVTVIIVGLMLRLPSTIPKVDASHDSRAERFGAAFVADTPQNAILFASDDAPVFALWYFHHALDQRADVAVIAEALLPYEWYIETLTHTYPTLNIRTTRLEIIRNNPNRPVCVISFASPACKP